MMNAPFEPEPKNASALQKMQYQLSYLHYHRPLSVPLAATLILSGIGCSIVGPINSAEIARDTAALQSAVDGTGVEIESIASAVRGNGESRTVLATIAMLNCHFHDSRLVFGDGEGMDVTGYTVHVPPTDPSLYQPIPVIVAGPAELAQKFPAFVANCDK